MFNFAVTFFIIFFQKLPIEANKNLNMDKQHIPSLNLKANRLRELIKMIILEED